MSWGKTTAISGRLNWLSTIAPTIDSEIPDGLIGDPGRLRQILLNLVGNAIKFTESGEVVVNVRIVSQTDEDTVLQFSVRDTGVGIPPTGWIIFLMRSSRLIRRRHADLAGRDWDSRFRRGS
ncbi:MAG TPA: hypothetical protein EYG03_25290 [Planctomycetes bacterium]|nr:hypothetical protein [Planctomycetota bacterium]